MDPNTQFNPQPAPQPPQDGYQPPAQPPQEQFSQPPVATPDPAGSQFQQSPIMPQMQPTPAPSPAPVMQQPMQPAPAPQFQPQPMQPMQPPAPNMNPGMPQQFNQPKKGIPKIAFMIGGGVLGVGVLVGIVFGILSLLDGGVKLVEYKQEDAGFSIKYPEGWDVDDTSSGVEFTEKESDGDDGKYLGVVTVEVTPREEFNDIYSTQEEAFDSFSKLIDEGIKDQDEGDSNFITDHSIDEKKINGSPALVMTLKVKNFEDIGEDETGEGRFVFIYGDKEVVTLDIIVHSSDTKYLKSFDDIVDSYEKI